MSERVSVDGVGRRTPGLHLLRDALGVGRSEDADFGDCAQVGG